MIKLTDLIRLSGITLGHYKIHCATGKKTSPLEAFFEGKFKEWQESQNQRNFQCDQILSLIHIHRNKWLFDCKILPMPPELDDINLRLTVDTESDFKISQKVYKEVGEDWWGYILTYLKKHPIIAKKMKKNIRKNQK